MDITSPPYTEIPVRFLDVRFANGGTDSLVLTAEDTLTVDDTHLHVVCGPGAANQETITYERGGWGVVCYRLRLGTLKRRPNGPLGGDPGTNLAG